MVFKLSCAQGFCILGPGTLKNKPRSPILELDLETHLVHNRGKYHQSSLNGFQVLLNISSSQMDVQIYNLKYIMPPATSGGE